MLATQLVVYVVLMALGSPYTEPGEAGGLLQGGWGYGLPSTQGLGTLTFG